MNHSVRFLSGKRGCIPNYNSRLLSVHRTLLNNYKSIMINNKHLMSLAATFVLVLSSFTMSAQYKGVVLDAADNSPLPGAVVNAGQKSAMTDMDGRWNLDVAKGTQVSISFVGYESKTVTLSDNKQITTKLSYDQAASTLDEVVVVGYGVQK